MMKRYGLIINLCIIFISFISGTKTWGAEPSMATYTCYPIFQVNAVEPNILIMLDNSGSMNFNAYGTWPGQEGLVRDKPYAGAPYNGRIGVLVNKSSDDAEEWTGAVGVLYSDVYIGVSGTTNIIDGFRFQNIDIPPGATITEAYIQFKAYGDWSGTASFSIAGEASDNAATYTTATNNISGRSYTAATATWSPTAWTNGTTYNSADLTSVVQEIVNRGGWNPGNAMAFKITGTGFRRAYAQDYASNESYAPMLYIKYAGAEEVQYYGYFNPEYFYSYGSNKFTHKYKKVAYHDTGTHSTSYWETKTSTGATYNLTNALIASEKVWDGNWMNWLCMRRIDVLRKVLVGGYITSRTGGGNETVFGETCGQSTRSYVKYFDSSAGAAVSPHDGAYYYGMPASANKVYAKNSTTSLFSSNDNYSIAVQKSVLYDPDDFDVNGDKVVGILQRVGSRARWADEWFYDGETDSGGFIQNTMGANMTTLITDLQNTKGGTSTPLAEAYYVAVQYYKQEAPQSGLGYPNSAVPHANVGQDPYYNTNQFVPCAKSFVLMLTDGASTVDAKIPDFLKDYDADGKENYTATTTPTTCPEAYGTTCDYKDGGTDYLDDIALYARTTDLRSATVGKTNLDGNQNLLLYGVLAFEDDENAVNLLSDACKNGGYEEKNSTLGPDLQSEWDADGNNVPDTFFQASDGYMLETELLKAINDILKRSASATAVSVLSTSEEGEGTLVQAYFKPVVPSGLTTINWVGYLQSLWVDAYGNLREDTNGNDALDVSSDRIITTFLDESSSDTKAKVWYVSSTNQYPDTKTAPYDEIIELDDILPIWDGGKMLAERAASDRKIFTYIDKNEDGLVNETGNNLDALGEIVAFNSGSMSVIKPYLGVLDSTSWSYLGTTQDARATNLILYIRGTDNVTTKTRKRTIDYDGDSVDEVWKLGDIIHSTPVTVSKPTDNYHLIYGDESYGEYYNTYKNRETVVYVGANDGMLHAFTGGVYHEASKQFIKKGADTTDTADDTTENLGDELWAYMPQALLPHLKWLPSKSYTHIYYVDLKPKIFDAKIDHDNNPATPDEWRTLLLLGLNLGGKTIKVVDDFNYDGDTKDTGDTRYFYSSYTCLDVTDPRDPRVMWEKTYDDLDLTTSSPAVMKVKNKWFAIFGSGPSDCDCSSSKNGHIYVVDLTTGAPYQSTTGIDWLFETAEDNAMMNSPVTVDKNLNYNVDAIYFGESYYSSPDWMGKIYKVAVPCIDNTGKYNDIVTSTNNYYSDDPNGVVDIDNKWRLYPLFDATKPITSSVTLSSDNYDNLWIYVGSGRYLSNSDKTSTDQQYMFGVKDPFYNRKMYSTSYYHDYSTYKELALSDLLDSDPYFIQVGGTVYYDANGNGILETTETASSWGTWTNLLATARAEDGWVRSLNVTGERIITRFSVLGGIVFTPSYVPSTDVCGYGGDSYLYGQYYETGTAYYKAVFEGGTNTYGTITTVLDKKWIGAGLASSIGVHVGKEGSKGFIQTSTGTIVEEELETAFSVKSGLRSWREK
jgi:type IV pilus assembly protein PilY1